MAFGIHFIGNPDLKNETSKNFDIGVEYKGKNSGLEIALNYFNTNWGNLWSEELSQTPTGPQSTFINVSDAKMDGLEVNVSFDLGKALDKKYSLRAYYNVTHLFTSDQKNNETGMTEPIFGNFDGAGNLGLNFEHNDLFIGINGRMRGVSYVRNFIGGHPRIRPNTTDPILELPRHMIVDFRAGYGFLKHHKLQFNLYNALNERYMEGDPLILGVGRNFRLSYNYSF